MKKDPVFYRDPYEGIRPEMLPIDEFYNRYPYGLSKVDTSRYKVIGVYHTLLPNRLQDALKMIPLYAQEIEEPKMRRQYKRKQYEAIIRDNPQYFRTGMSEQLERVEKELKRQELIEENRARKLAERKPAVRVKKEERPTLTLLTPRNKKT